MFFVEGNSSYKGLLILMIVESFLIVFLNSAAVFTLVYRRSKHNRRSTFTPDKQILSSLCVANFISGAAVIVEFSCYAAGEAVSSKKVMVLTFFVMFSLIVSLIHVIVLSMERFLSIKFPFRHREITKTHATVVILLVWLFSIGPTCTIILDRKSALYSIACIMLVTDAFLIMSSIYIVRVTKRVLNNPNSSLLAHNKEQKALENQITRFWCTVVISYVCCTIPPVIVLITRSGDAMTIYEGSMEDSFMLILILLKAVVDPLVYIFMNQNKCCLCCQKNDEVEDTTKQSTTETQQFSVSNKI